jgi:RNA polymerase-binding transcription factor DksA
MTNQDREHMKRLEANRAALARLATSFEQETGLHRPLAESVGDIMTHDYEDTDFAQALSDREINDTLVHLLGENREQVERALERLSAGKYGVCEDCDEPIATERLKFRPEATRCVGCQARWDRLNRRSA